MGDSTKCSTCRRKITGEYANIDGQPYHFHCVKCATCKDALSAEDVYSHNKQLFCGPCHQSQNPKCSDCKTPSGQGKKVDFFGKDTKTGIPNSELVNSVIEKMTTGKNLLDDLKFRHEYLEYRVGDKGKALAVWPDGTEDSYDFTGNTVYQIPRQNV